MNFIVSLSDDAVADLDRLHGWIDERGGSTIADEYDAKLRRFVRGLADFPHRGTPHGAGLDAFRTITYQRRQVVAYRVVNDRVEVLRIVDAVRDWPGLLSG